MVLKVIKFGIVAVGILSFTLCFGQDKSFDSFLKKLDETTSKQAQEKVYLHMDKPYYAVGDDIWFKAYTINAKTGLPSTISGLLYVELINERDSITKQLKLPMKNGITWGDFRLTDSLSEGNYRIRAYTQWMRNTGPEFFFDKTIKIGNSWANKVFTKSNNILNIENGQQKIVTTIQFTDKQNLPYANCQISYEVKLNNKTLERGKDRTDTKGEITIQTINKQPNVLKNSVIIAKITLPSKELVTKEIPIKISSKDVDVQFFPEGGKLVEELPNRIGIKAINNSGLGELIKGTIVDSNGIEISRFETNRFGMGSCFLNPMLGQSYKANLIFTDGTKKTANLPTIEKSGLVLSVSNLDSTRLFIKIYVSKDLINKGEYNLIAQHNGNTYFSKKIVPNRQMVSLNVPKDSLPSGIVQISLLSSTFAPLNERVVFVNNVHDKIEIAPEGLRTNYTKREKIELSMATTSNRLSQGSFSVSVTNTSAVRPDPENETNILTKLLLTSDLTGFVEKPNYYFLNNNRSTRADLDNLMLTQGWRKINWEQVIDTPDPSVRFPAEKRLQISGTVSKNGKPVIKGKVSLTSFNNGFFMVDTLTDEKGHFTFDKLAFVNNTKFVVQAKTDKNKGFVDIMMDVVQGQATISNPNTGDIEVNVNQSLAIYLQESNKYFDDQTNRGLLNRTILLKTVNIVEKQEVPRYSSNLGGTNNADAVFTAKDLENVFSLPQYLLSKVAGSIVKNGLIHIRSNVYPMAVFVDGVRLNEKYSLDDIRVHNIGSVEILKSPSATALYGAHGGAGVIIINTKRGDEITSTSAPSPGLISYSPKGHSPIRQFYSPKYNVTSAPDNNTDLRTTVYWEPNLTTDKDGIFKISYFNTDVPGIYRIVIEGIDVNGSLARKVLTYEVK